MWNDVDMGPVVSQPAVVNRQGGLFVNGIRCLGSGYYLVAENRIVCNFENAAGIRLQGNYDAGKGKVFPIRWAVVVNNDVIMTSTTQPFGPDTQRLNSDGLLERISSVAVAL